MADLTPYSEDNTARTGKRDPQASRQALLTAAIAEFAGKGPAGARVDEIARRAGVNKQMVYHYFGNKDDLFRAALEEVYGRIRARERALNLSDLPPVRAMESLVGFSFDYLAEHPEFIALLNDENRYGAMHLDGLREVQSMHLPLVELIRDALQRGVREGVFRDDIDPINLYISIAGLSYFFFSNNRTLSAIFGTNLGDTKAVAVRRRHVIEFALGALRPLQP
ncbi:TetR/AcrR family transcriptional regulator [Microvirga tunisiensis]|jgi:TetR/AcrR family transcriptional regulator|uniref:TetR/AcrR family transcriptional regulator n=1 Tax=Microvirga tunisiensis TaxID=2108360 RepID=A0A5N7MU26_9HYPH|nr:TetR/AcrR family transcriptional regulator [Microvirga tunisiensis]MPR07934.1 TetR/AcrR family transcriptional regulator [Microvirga tunisiensis]MPR27546.1 TetR/AcrR family transcriptional regulator [Microvirga tunisiensis]